MTSPASFLLLFLAAAEAAKEQLVFVSAVWRHGARAPEDQMSDHPSIRAAFPYGLKELTEAGIRHSYELGRFFQYRYMDDTFLSRFLSNKEIYLQSVDVNRCLMTATSVAQGMYSHPSRIVPLPVPIHTRPIQNDWMLAFPWHRCDALQREFTKYCDFPDIHMLDTYAKYMAALFDCSGYRGTYFNDTATFNRIESLISQELSGAPLPSWYTPSLRREARALYSKVQRFQQGVDEFHNPTLLRLTVGQLFDTIQKEIIHKWNCVRRAEADAECAAIRPLKFKGLSAQDAVLSSLLEVLGARKEALSNALNPQFNSAIIFELWSVDDMPLVKVLYKRGSHTSLLVNLSGNVRNCQGVIACPLEQFAFCCDAFRTSSPQAECAAASPLISAAPSADDEEEPMLIRIARPHSQLPADPSSAQQFQRFQPSEQQQQQQSFIGSEAPLESDMLLTGTPVGASFAEEPELLTGRPVDLGRQQLELRQPPPPQYINERVAPSSASEGDFRGLRSISSQLSQQRPRGFPTPRPLNPSRDFRLARQIYFMPQFKLTH